MRKGGPMRESRPGPCRPSLAAALLALALPATAAAQEPAAPGEDALPGPVPAECVDRPLAAVSVVRPWEGELDAGGVRCLGVGVEAGEFVRARAEVDASASMFGLVVEVWAPGDTGEGPERVLRLTPTLGATLNGVGLSWEAGRGGRHVVVMRDLWMWSGGGMEAPGSTPARLRIEGVEPPALVRARREALEGDARVAWLARHAVPVRSISPDDRDFRDLEPLRESLEGVRVALLGEATHGSGADFLAKSRLVRFLHREMGFDVLAFEAGMYAMAVAWDSLRAGARGRDAFELGMWRMWPRAAEMQPLIEYVATEAAGERPLELAGFDNQFMPHGASLRFAEDLARFLEARGIGGPLVEAGSPERRALEAMASMRFRRGEEPLPPPEVWEALVGGLEETTAALAGSRGDEEARFWGEVLRGTTCHARRVWAESGEGELPERCLRDRQMARHLTWLANERYPERKIVAWAANSHVMRAHEMVPAAGSGPSMGQGVWEALGEASYAIATTSYRGTFGLAGAPSPQHVIVDQDPRPEFEELMEAAGFEHALVDLRRARTEGSWLAAPFLARPEGHVTEERAWSDALDALFFLRDQRQPGRDREP